MDEKKSVHDFIDDNRLIYMSGKFSEDAAKDVVSQLLKFNYDDPKKDILMVIDSYGGIVDSFIAIHDTMRLIRCDVATLCIGKAMSCGHLLLTSGTKGKRFITPNSRIMVHQVSAGTWGKLSEMENSVEETKRLEGIINKLIIKYSKITKRKLTDLLSKDSYLSPEKGLEYGFIDTIVRAPSHLYKNLKL